MLRGWPVWWVSSSWVPCHGALQEGGGECGEGRPALALLVEVLAAVVGEGVDLAARASLAGEPLGFDMTGGFEPEEQWLERSALDRAEAGVGDGRCDRVAGGGVKVKYHRDRNDTSVHHRSKRTRRSRRNR